MSELLMETGEALLKEDGDAILLELSQNGGGGNPQPVPSSPRVATGGGAIR